MTSSIDEHSDIDGRAVLQARRNTVCLCIYNRSYFGIFKASSSEDWFRIRPIEIVALRIHVDARWCLNGNAPSRSSCLP
jgi:hypothetical protein